VEPPASPLHDPVRDLYVVPVRHHSPACAAHLARLIDAVAPAAILIEGPCDFDPLIPLVTDARTRPPVAIVAMREAKKDGGRRRTASYFPFCAHSPEYVALAAGAARGVPARFIDLPSLSREMADEADEDSSRSLLGDEHVFDSGDYVRALAAELGCRDGNEAWDHLFEARVADADWRRFFTDVGHYCACLRGATDPACMARDGTLAREAQMRALIAEARAACEGPIVAVVGGFHASALIDGSVPPGTPIAPRKGDGSAFLIRYGHRQLNALTGYAAGLPLPGYYDTLWRRAAERPEEQPFSALTLDLLTGFAAHLRESGLGGAPSFPVMASAAEQAERLARLRGRPGPMRTDLVDAIRSTFLKEEAPRAGTPLLRELDAWLTGSAIGDVPPSAGSPPLVEAVRKQARRLGFSVADGERRSRDLDIYREERHRAASRFCHAMALIGTPFAQRTGGPDFRHDVDLDRLHEIWSVCWSPLVEARLIELAAEADTLPEALAIAIADQLAQLRELGRGRSASAAIDLFAAACRAGIGEEANAILTHIEAEAIEDPDLGPVVGALADLVQILRNRAMLGIEDPTPIERLIGALWRRALFLLPDIAQAGPEQARPLLDALVTLRALTEQARAGHAPIDVAPFDEHLARLIGAPLHPMLAGAVAAYALIDGQMAEERFAARLRGELEGGYVAPADRLAFLTGVIALARELLWTMPTLVDTLDAVIAGADDDGFVDLLPHVRLALGPLDPREIDRLAQAVARRHGAETIALVSIAPIDEATLLRNLALDRTLAARLAKEGVA
jgi:hypothetical protein